MNQTIPKWDYTSLAKHYGSRPNYAAEAIDRMCKLTGVGTGSLVCDVGAGTGHLTKLLLARGFQVTAVEPNEAMREIGESLTAGKNVVWRYGTGEDIGAVDNTFDLVTYGSSFNTTNRAVALKETSRVLKPGRWFACMWNHRVLTDPLQAEVEGLIKATITGYDYGTRREDQTDTIASSGLFDTPVFVEANFTADIAAADYVDAWRSHATLQKQAGDKFADIIKGIEQIVSGKAILTVPYMTRLWTAQVLKQK